MSIYDRVRGGNPINPAVALYNHWHTLLVGMPACKRDAEGRLQARSGYGSGWYNVAFHHAYADIPDVSTRPPISYGGMILRSNGTFHLGNYHGWKQRDVISRHTFLRWGHVHGEYVWFVDTDASDGGYYWTNNAINLKDWNAPVPYVAERVAGGTWRRPGPLLKLSWDGASWQITFGGTIPAPSQHHTPVTQETWDWYTQLREKRYRRYEREHLIRTGVLKPRVRRVISPEEAEARRDAALQVIVAHMNISTAARTTPLRKTTEEVGLWEPSGCP